MEECISVLREMENLLADSLRHHDGYQRWWYHIPCIDGSDNCLNDYLGIDKDQYQSIMVDLGFMAKSDLSTHGYRVNTRKIKKFLERHQLEVELEPVKVTAITNRQILWIGLGKYNSEERYKAHEQWYMADLQYEERSNLALGQLKRKERGPLHTIERKSNKDLLAYSKISSNWKEKLSFMCTLYQKQNGQENLGSIMDEEMSDSLNEEIMEENSDLSSLIVLLNEEFNSALSSSCTSDTVTITFPRNNLRSSLKKFIHEIGTKVLYPNHNKEEIESEVVQKYPILNNSLIPKEKSIISRLLDELGQLQTELYGSLTSTSYNGKSRTLVIVPQVATSHSFRVHGKKAIEKFIEGFVSSAKVDAVVEPEMSAICINYDGEDMATTENEVQQGIIEDEKSWIASKILDYLSSNYKEEFMHVGKKKGYLMELQKMDAFTTLAMYQESNMTLTTLRVIKTYLHKILGGPILASEYSMKRLIEDSVKPVIETSTFQGTDYKWYVKPLRKVLESKMSFSTKDIESQIENIDVVYAGDHGQGKFRLSVKINIYFSNGKLLCFAEDFGELECKKDTYHLLFETIGNDMDDGLQTLLESDGKTGKEWLIISSQETFVISIPQTQLEKNEFINSHSEDDILMLRPRIRITGDLAFYAVMLGKYNMDSKWCTWCSFYCAISDWEKGSDIGDIWTKASLANILAKNLEDESKPKPILTAQERLGVRSKPLVDVCPTILIIPPLHMKLGLFNHAIVNRTGHSFWSWMELRVQNISDDERNARSIYLDYKLNHVEAKNQLEEWNSINLDNLNEMREENKELVFELSFPLRSGRYTKDEKEQLKLEKAELKEKIDELVKEQKECKDEIKERKKLLDIVKREYEYFTKKRNWRGLTVRRIIEALLRKYGIDFSAYHGGDLTGRPIQNFCEKANQIFDEIQTVLIETVNSPGYSCLANENEVRDVCSRFKQLTILMDGFFSLHMMSRQEFRNTGVDEVRTRCIKYVNALQTKWRDLHLSIQAPKFHALSHFETQFVSNEGLGAFHEQFAEIAHRDGERDRKRIGAIRDVQKRASSQSWYRQIGSNQEVQAMKKIFSPPKKRQKNIDKERERNEVRSIVLDTVTNELANNTNTKMKNYWSRN